MSASTDIRHTEAGGQTAPADGLTAPRDSLTVSPGDPIANSCRTSIDSGVDGTSSSTAMEEDTYNDLVDYEPSLACDGMEINVIYLSSTNYSLIKEKEVSQLAIGPQDVVFKKPTELRDHLKSLYIRGHQEGTPVARILVDEGTAVNVMPYSTFKKLGKSDAKLIKMNMMIAGIRGDEPIGPKGVASMELTMGSKMIPTAFLSWRYKVTTTLS
jgi:hypothetical protein